MAAVGVVGSEEDCARFMEIMIADFNRRCGRCAATIFKGRVQLLPVEETLPDG